MGNIANKWRDTRWRNDPPREIVYKQYRLKQQEVIHEILEFLVIKDLRYIIIDYLLDPSWEEIEYLLDYWKAIPWRDSWIFITGNGNERIQYQRKQLLIHLPLLIKWDLCHSNYQTEPFCPLEQDTKPTYRCLYVYKSIERYYDPDQIINKAISFYPNLESVFFFHHMKPLHREKNLIHYWNIYPVWYYQLQHINTKTISKEYWIDVFKLLISEPWPKTRKQQIIDWINISNEIIGLDFIDLFLIWTKFTKREQWKNGIRAYEEINDMIDKLTEPPIIISSKKRKRD
jgi:hypothetical protein